MRLSKLVLGFLLVALATITWAQTATTSLRGTVTDAGGAVIPNASVTLSRAETGFTRTVQSDNQGVYQFLQLQPATYDLQVSGKGFAQASQRVQLLVNTPATVDVKLGVEAASTTIDVSGEAPLVNTQDASLGAAFNNQQILALPFEGRDPVGILSLQPGVTYITTSENSDSLFDSRGGAVNGARSDQTNVTLDGVDNNDQVGGTAFSGALRSTLDSLQEFRVVTSSANADTGRSSGGQVSMVTKSGTNNFHGALYEYHRPTFGRANDWFNKKAQIENDLENKPAKFIRNTFGGAIGGPIVKDRLFFFGTYEGQRKRESVQVTRTIPTETLRQGILQYVDTDGNIVTLSPTDIASMDGCTTSCPWGPGPNPNVLQYWGAYPTPNNFSVGDGLNTAGYTFAAPIPQNFNNYIAKFDWNATASGTHRLFARLNVLSDRLVPGLAGAAELPGQEPSFETVNTSKGIAVGYTATLSNTLINNFRYGYVRQQTATGGPNQQHYVDFRGIDEPIFFGNALSQAVPVHNFVNDVVWTKASHTFQFGGNWRLITNSRQSNAQNFFNAVTNPSWTQSAAIAGAGGSLDPGDPANGFPEVNGDFAADYDIAAMALMGIVPEVTSQYNVNVRGDVIPEGDVVPRKFRNNEYEFYAQDSWRAKPNLTFTLGLRYTLLQPPYETSGNQVAPTTSLHDWFEQRKAGMLRGEVVNPTLTFDISGQANGKKPYWDWDKTNFAPRFSFAFSPNAEGGFWKALFGGPGRSSIRGGYGMYFDHFGIGVVNSFDKQGSFGLTTSQTNSAGVQTVEGAPRFTAQGEIPQSLVSSPPPTSYPVTPPEDLFQITWGLDDKLKTPYSHVFDFSITRELPGNFVFEGAYVGRLGRRLLQQLDLAMPLNLVDSQSGMDYFTAATMLSQAYNNGTDIANVAPIPYFENLFAGAAGIQSNNPDVANFWGDPFFGCSPGYNGAVPYSATQNMYDMWSCFVGNETTALFAADLYCAPACANGQPFQFFSPQYSSLYAWSSIGSSSYHAGQFILRRRMQNGLQFDFNYTLSKSIDMGSDAERLSLFDSNSGGFGWIINSWNPRQNRGVSDFDTRHSINANYVWELPFGRKRTFGAGWGGVAEAILGGWQTSGVFRWSSGLPFSLGPGLGYWATNWELTSYVVPVGALPETGVFDNNGNPNVFRDPSQAKDVNEGGVFRRAYPGENGPRNNLRGPGIFNIDMGLAKNWNITESQRLQFRWEVFNITNSVRFDAQSMSYYNGSTSNSAIGNFVSPTNSVPRVMQFALRYEF